MSNQDINNCSMLDLFRMEVEAQAEILNNNLLALENNPTAATELEALMRASHSIKGAARVVQLDAAVNIAHVMEDCFVASQNGKISLDSPAKVDVLLSGVDMLLSLSKISDTELEAWLSNHQAEINNLVTAISVILTDNESNNELNTEKQNHFHSSTPIFFPSPTPTPSPIPTPTLIPPPGVRDLSMLSLFRAQVETQATFLNQKLSELKSNTNASLEPEFLIQAAHEIKGIGKIVYIDAVVKIANVLEESFLIIQKRKIPLQNNQIDNLLIGINWLLRLAQVPENHIESWLLKHNSEIAAFTSEQPKSAEANSLPKLITTSTQISQPVTATPTPQFTLTENVNSRQTMAKPSVTNRSGNSNQEMAKPLKERKSTSANEDHSKSANSQSADRVVRVSADNLNRLMGLAGESLVEANWLQPFADSLFKLRNYQLELYGLLGRLEESLADELPGARAQSYLASSRKKADECRQFLADRLIELELFARRSANLSDRLYREVIASHMRPFADGVQSFPRMMRDLARRLGKQVKFEIVGKSTQVDRDILEKLEAPLTHILRNALDHGLESSEERLACGKPAEGTVRLEATHRAGMLLITVSDDGQGVDLERLRQKIINKGMTTAEMAAQLTEAELMEFMFLPGFSTKSAVTEISGRGVGLDVVQSMVQEVGGIVRAVSQPGKGMTFHLQLPLTLSVIRTLLVKISGEPYAFPLARIERIVRINHSDITYIENRQYFNLDGQNIGLVAAHQVLDLHETVLNADELSILIISDRSNRYGLVVDCFLGERDLVVRPLDTRLGKVPDISAAALMPDGSPVLIIDVEDLITSIDKRLNTRLLSNVNQSSSSTKTKGKRILVVDDSITVREVERKLLQNNGYQVEVAVNGMDGWNAVRTGHYDLVISDIDMPRMNGFELVGQIKNHPNLHSLPVIIVSYKDRESDRITGLEVGADYYLTKSSFHDDTLLNAVIDLIGN